MGSFICDCPKGYEGDGMTNGTGCRPIATHYRSIAIELGKYLRIEFETFRSVIMIMIIIIFFWVFVFVFIFVFVFLLDNKNVPKRK
jgi:hypothetical protein